MTPKTARIGSWIVLSSLVLFLVLAIVFVAIGWGSADVATGQSMSTAGYVAMAFGIVATLALASGSCRSSSTAIAKATTRPWERHRHEKWRGLRHVNAHAARSCDVAFG